jgi:hypothetical protein
MRRAEEKRSKKENEPPRRARNKLLLPDPVAPQTRESFPSGKSTVISLNSNFCSSSVETSSPSVGTGFDSPALASSSYTKVPLSIPTPGPDDGEDGASSERRAETHDSTSGSSKNASRRCTETQVCRRLTMDMGSIVIGL